MKDWVKKWLFLRKDLLGRVVEENRVKKSTSAKNEKKLTEEGHQVRVVSMPCIELFEEQSESYKQDVLPNTVRKRIVVEAAEAFGWHKYIGLDGASVTMSSFGASAPGGTCMEKFGFTVDNVIKKAKDLLS